MNNKSVFETTIEPRFCETDAVGHIGNTAMPGWLEHARIPIFKEIHPTMNAKGWPLIVAKISIDYLGQIFAIDEVKIQTSIAKIGNKSFTVSQSVFQNNQKVAYAETVIVYFDYTSKQTITIPEKSRKFLESRLSST